MLEQPSRSTPEMVSAGLGWFSVALGTAELLAPRAIASIVGARPSSGNLVTIRALGAREVATGLAILASPDRPGAVWSRVAGDAIDLAALGGVLASRNGHTVRTVAAAVAVLGVAAADWWCAAELAAEQPQRQRGIDVHAAVTIRQPIGEVYRFWRNFENFPKFMRRLESVTRLSETRSRWRMTGPAGIPLEWDADIVTEQPEHLLTWQSVEGAAVRHHGGVRFEPAPAGRGTEIHVEMRYDPPGGQAGRAIAWLFGSDPKGQIREDLRRVKQILEVGEVVISEGPGISRAAQPPERVEDIKASVGVAI